MYFLNRFDVLISKINFKKLKNIINIKNYLKNNHCRIIKLAATQCVIAQLVPILEVMRSKHTRGFFLKQWWSSN